MSLQEVIERIRNRPEPANSRAVERRIVVPILRELRWDDSDDTQVDFGYLLGGRSNDEIDFALRGSAGTGLALLQLLEPGSQSTMAALRIINGAVADHFALAILSNGAEWWFYLPPAQPGPPEQQCFAQINLLSDPVDRCMTTMETFLSRARLEGGDAISDASKTLASARARDQVIAQLPSVWKRLLSEPDSMLVELLQEEVSRAVSAEAEQEDVVAFLREQVLPRSPAVSEPRKVLPPVGKQADVVTGTAPTSVILWGQRRNVTKWNEVWIFVAESVYARHRREFEKALVLRGRSVTYVTSSAKNLRRGHQVRGSRYWIELHGSAIQLYRWCHALLEVFGYPPEELKVDRIRA